MLSATLRFPRILELSTSPPSALIVRVRFHTVVHEVRGMGLISALNASDSSGEDSDSDVRHVSEEALETDAFGIYNAALQAVKAKDIAEARKCFLRLLDHPFIVKHDGPLAVLRDGSMHPSRHMKYATLKNLAQISADDEGDEKDLERAAEYYLAALDIDETDVSVWYHTGLVAVRLKNFPMAGECFRAGLLQNPRHWLCLHEAMLVHYVMADDIGCLNFVADGLSRDPHYTRALILRRRILGHSPLLKETWEKIKCHYGCDDTAVVDEEEAKELNEAVERMVAEFVEECRVPPSKDPNDVPFRVPLPEAATVDGVEAWEPSWVKFGQQALDSLTADEEATSSPFNQFRPVDVRVWFEAADANLAVLQAEIDETIRVRAEEAAKAKEVGEQDGEKKDETSEDKGKKTKRRRMNELSKLEEWGFVKRRASGRATAYNAKTSFAAMALLNRTKGHMANVNFEEMLAEYLPASLIQCPASPELLRANSTESLSGSAEVSQADFINSGSNSGDESPKLTAGSRETKTESEDKLVKLQLHFDALLDFRHFLHDNNRRKAFEFFHELSSKIGRKSGVWEKGLPQIFLKIYGRARGWYPHMIRNCNPTDQNADFSEVVNDAWLTLIGADLLADRCQFWTSDVGESQTDAAGGMTYENHEDTFANELEALIIFVMNSTRLMRGDDSWPEFYIRLNVLQARLAVISDRTDDALYYLELAKRWLENCCPPNMEIKLPNCFFFQKIDVASIDRQIAELGRQQSLSGLMDLYHKNDFKAVIDLLMPTLCAPSENEGKPGIEAKIKDMPDRHMLLQILVDSVVQLKDYARLFQIAHPALDEAIRNFETIEEALNAEMKESWCQAIVYVLDVLDAILYKDPSVLEASKSSDLALLSKDLMRIIQINFDFVNNSRNISTSADRRKMLIKSLCPWSVLYRLAAHGEKPNEPKNDGVSPGEDESIPGSVFVLLTGHEWLGRQGWCCSDSGTFLLQVVKILTRLPCYAKNKNSLLDQALEQCFFCLYSYPSKKTRAKHLADHGVNGIELTWDRAVDLYRFVGPEELPEFDSYRIPSISADLEAMLRRIAALVPTIYDPATYVSELERYVDGEGAGKLLVAVPEKVMRQMRRMPDLYFMLADFYLKNKEWNKAARYYLHDAVINPMRMDSWAGNALARTGALETKLNSCQPFKQDRSVFDRTAAALRCFHRTLILDKKNVKMWIEFGSVSYMMHSHASRSLKQDSSLELPIEMLAFLEKEKENLLAKAKHCFETAARLVAPPKAGAADPDDADDDDGWDERWLHYYMLGKIMLKFGAPVHESLCHFHRASELLHEVGACYPKKVNYTTPQFLALEALEVYYRIHATSLKQLMLWEEGMFTDDYEEQVQVMGQVLSLQEKSPFALADESAVLDPGAAVVDGVLRSIVDEVVAEADPSLRPRDPAGLACAVERQALVQKCLNALKECAFRFPHHYKSIYRCAQYYYGSATSKDLFKARNILLGVPGRTGAAAAASSAADLARYSYMPGPGLFAERKRNNLFNGVWRIPSNEVDRPGSFAAHMARSVNLLVSTSVQLQDFNTLLAVSVQLARKPEADKMYLYETERKHLSTQALESGLVVLRQKLASALETGSEAAKREMLLDIYRARARASKHPVPYHGFTPLLIEAYVGFRGGAVETGHGPAILEEAIRFCSPLVKDVDDDFEPGDRKRKRKKDVVAAEDGPSAAKHPHLTSADVSVASAAARDVGAELVGSGDGSAYSGDVVDLCGPGGDESSDDSDAPPEAPPSPPSRASSPGDNYLPGKKLPTAVSEVPSRKRGGRGGRGGRKPGVVPGTKRPRLASFVGQPGEGGGGGPGADAGVGASFGAAAVTSAAAAATAHSYGNVMGILDAWQAQIQGQAAAAAVAAASGGGGGAAAAAAAASGMDPFLASLLAEAGGANIGHFSAAVGNALFAQPPGASAAGALQVLSGRGSRRPRGNVTRTRSGLGRGSRGPRGGGGIAVVAGAVGRGGGDGLLGAPMALGGGRGRGRRGPRGPRGSSLTRPINISALMAAGGGGGGDHLGQPMLLGDAAAAPFRPATISRGRPRGSRAGTAAVGRTPRGSRGAGTAAAAAAFSGGGIPPGLSIRPVSKVDVAAGGGGGSSAAPDLPAVSVRTALSPSPSPSSSDVNSCRAALSELARRPGLEIVPNARPPSAAASSSASQAAAAAAVSEFQKMFEESFLARREARP